MKIKAGKTFFLNMFLAVGVAFMLSACGSGGGGSSSGTTTTTTTATASTTTASGASATATLEVTGTGTQGSTSATALTVADQVSVVESSSSTTASSPLKSSVPGLRIGSSLHAVTLPSAWLTTADYYTTPTFTFTEEKSQEALDEPNQILCMIGQTNYDEMVNQGAYIARIDTNKCNSGRDDAGEGGKSSTNSGGSNAPKYEDWTVLVNRADDTSPQVVSAWIPNEVGHGQGGGSEGKIFAKITIAESSTTANPYGMFTLQFRAHPATAGVVDETSTVMHGVMKTMELSDGTVILQFYNVSTETNPIDSSSINITMASAVSRSTDGSTGGGEASFPNFEAFYNNATGTPDLNSISNTVWRFAYDSKAFVRAPIDSTGTVGATKCADRVIKTKTAWRYGLFNSADGSKKKLNGGFPIVYTDGSSVKHQGFVSFWGLWMENNYSLPNPSTVVKQDWSGGAAVETSYTYKKSIGKLHKHQNKQSTLDKFKNVNMSYWDQNTGTNYNMSWNATTKVFDITGKSTWQGEVALGSTDPTTLDVTTLQWSQLSFWSQGMGGEVYMQFPVNGDTGWVVGGNAGINIDGTTNVGCIQTGGWDPTAGGGSGAWTGPEQYDCSGVLSSNPALVKVTFLTDELVYPADSTVPTSLTCYDQCPDSTTFATTTANTSIFHTQTDYNNPTAYTYGWDNTGYKLTDTFNSANTAIDLSSSTSGAGANSNLMGDWGPLTWGLQTGALFDPTATDSNSNTYASLLVCPWDVNTTCTWMARQVLPVFYTWESGTQDWNVLTALEDSTTGVPVQFDQPIQVNYTYPATATTGYNTTATDTKYASVPFRFEYGGFGDLWGIPGHCVNGETGADTDCFDPTADVWIRYIPEFMIPDGETVTDDASTPNTYYVKALEVEEQMVGLTNTDAVCTAVTLTSYTLPGETDYVKPDIGTEPVVTDPPAVIGGVKVLK